MNEECIQGAAMAVNETLKVSIEWLRICNASQGQMILVPNKLNWIYILMNTKTNLQTQYRV